ncbi:general secretion pathway protein A [Geobacter sp. OR-1]|uniref:XrtA/PEP-CTERM system-associated ATPase n=1 Tax=Geobacter sp. OR-1 TaxID=1266765 RepID=UPI0005423887|nr:XrtA/PEP-CTERM system-associated ATPase [Geobacter sp. OR-1]GAM10599.1 general secretion pathway protein A [Geobacter sp. OR-1]
MYESYFSLSSKPFELLPNPDFLFLSKSHKRALTYLDYGIQERVGFILLTGEVGSGKTTIIRDMLKKHHEQVVISKVFNTRVNSEQLIALINDDFGISIANKDKTVMLRDLNDFLVEQYAVGNFPVLIVDEAQNLTPKLLEEIRMLSNLETDSSKLLQIILVGQPELRDTISSPALRQLRQRISINCHLQPLSRTEMEQYIFHRLQVAGNRDAVSFSKAALDLIAANSQGIPRLINIICDFLLISAFAEGTRSIDEAMVKDVTGDLDFDRHFWGNEQGIVNNQTPPNKMESNISFDLSEISKALQKITTRLDVMERESRLLSESINKEFGQKLTELQNAFMFHVNETDSAITTLSTRVEKIKILNEDSDKDTAKSGKGGIVRKILGS